MTRRNAGSRRGSRMAKGGLVAGLMLALVCGGLFSGCALPTPQATPDPTILGSIGPAPTNCEAKIRAYMAHILREPDSAQYSEFSAPVPAIGEIGNPKIAGVVKMYGWAVTVKINAKNGLGEYIGDELDTFLFFNGDPIKIDRFTPVTPTGT